LKCLKPWRSFSSILGFAVLPMPLVEQIDPDCASPKYAGLKKFYYLHIECRTGLIPSPIPAKNGAHAQ